MPETPPGKITPLDYQGPTPLPAIPRRTTLDWLAVVYAIASLGLLGVVILMLDIASTPSTVPSLFPSGSRKLLGYTLAVWHLLLSLASLSAIQAISRRCPFWIILIFSILLCLSFIPLFGFVSLLLLAQRQSARLLSINS